jgi:hypothetical protein
MYALPKSARVKIRGIKHCSIFQEAITVGLKAEESE